MKFSKSPKSWGFLDLGRRRAHRILSACPDLEDKGTKSLSVEVEALEKNTQIKGNL